MYIYPFLSRDCRHFAEQAVYSLTDILQGILMNLLSKITINSFQLNWIYVIKILQNSARVLRFSEKLAPVQNQHSSGKVLICFPK